MSEPEADLLPTVTLQHRYGEQRLLANRADYIHEKDGRFRNWLLSDDDPEVQPPPCQSAPCESGPAPVLALSAPPVPVPPPAPVLSGKRRRRGRRK
ncbi:hypothetical protein [Nisaea denitrificans]|uniref:hypothetical protein n=1 Tax=Nisaea denitrificans TaxID=390877 RepID=UPI0003F962B2|nr:hypothetical protein [Nisaea denitrificans]